MTMETKTLSVSDSSSSVSFSATVFSCKIYNAGSSNAYVEFDSAATTSDFMIAPGKTLSINTDIDAVHAICDSAETTTLQIFGSI